MGSRILQDIQNVGEWNTSIGDVVVGLIVAATCGLIISAVYRWTYRGAAYSPSLVRSLIALAMITAVVMLVIGNNLARAFGLVGAMSIIRFRTALKDPHDIVFVFFALAAGMAAGVGMHNLALVSTVGISLVVAIMTGLRYADVEKESLILRFSYSGDPDETEASYLPVLKRFCKSTKLINVRADRRDQTELTFFAGLKRKGDNEALTRAMADLPEVSNVSLYHDSEQV